MPDPGTLAPLPSCEVMSKGFGWKLTPASALSRWGGGRMSRPIRRVLSPHAVTHARVAAIHLRRTLPHASSGLPGSSGEQPSNASCLALLPVGFASPHRSPGALVVSCTTVSPLPRPRRGVAVCFLWHCPAGHPGWVLPTTVLYGARTFLGEVSLAATAWPTHPRVKGSADESARRSRRGRPRRGTSGLRRARWWVTPTRGDPRDSATENRPPRPFGDVVRVKRWCKRPPAHRVTGAARQTPPGARPDRKRSRAARPSFRVGRWRRAATYVVDGWPPPARG